MKIKMFLIAVVLSVTALTPHTLSAQHYNFCSDSWNMIHLSGGQNISLAGNMPSDMRFYAGSSSLLWKPDEHALGRHKIEYVDRREGASVTNEIVIHVKQIQRVLCVLAHGDDEFGILAKVKRMIDSGIDVSLAWTSLHRNQRIDESKSAMRKIGIPEKNLHFLNCGNIVSPKGFAQYIDVIEDLMQNYDFDQIFIPAYEGGHVQHDLTHAATVAASRKCEFKGQIYEFGLYHFDGFFPMLFSLLPAPSPTIQLCLDKEAITFLETLSKMYRSQKHITAGFRLGMSAQKKLHPVYRPLPYWDYTRPPHKGILWYAANFKHPASFANDFSPAVNAVKALQPVSGINLSYAQDLQKSDVGGMLFADSSDDTPVRIRLPLSVYAYSTFVFFFVCLCGLTWKGLKFVRQGSVFSRRVISNRNEKAGGENA